MQFLTVISILILGLIIVWLVTIYNRFIRRKNLIAEAWSGIDVQLKRRYDLIPNLVESVKGYSQYERRLFDDIANIRSQCILAQGVKSKEQLENALTSQIRSLFAVAELYPDLKANQHFLDLQKNLSAIEDEIQLSRRYYNGTVREYNILLESFPSNLVGKLFGYKRAEFFEIETATQRETPSVKFSL
ncbi:MAG: LemA family protein [bacterium]|nr:LemA family protein [bacterium]